jgi:hypothetical protein
VNLKFCFFPYQNSEFLYVANQRAIHSKRLYERLYKDVLNHFERLNITLLKRITERLFTLKAT